MPVLCAVGLICLCCVPLLAQQAPDQQPGGAPADNSRNAPAPALAGLVGEEPGADSPTSELPAVPALLGGPGAELTFAPELDRHNYLRTGLSAGAEYNDNALISPTNELSNTSYTFFPTLSIDQSRSRIRMALNYAGGVTVNQRTTSRNAGSHSLGFDTEYRVSPHVNLRVAEVFSITTGFFNSAAGGGPVGSGGSNAYTITPLSKQTSSLTTLGASYHFLLNDLAGVSGSFSDSYYRDVPKATQLLDTQTVTGSAFWFHRLFGRDWLGASYRFDKMIFTPHGGDTRVHRVLAVNTINLPGRITITGFAGPEYSQTQAASGGTGVLSAVGLWSVSGGLDVGFQGLRSSLSGGVSRQISEGGGIFGPVRLTDVHASYRRQLLRTWTFTLGGSYGKNDSLLPALSSSTVPSGWLASASVGVEHPIGKDFALRFGYGHDFQRLVNTTSVLAGDAHRNRVYATLSYQWGRPIGN